MKCVIFIILIIATGLTTSADGSSHRPSHGTLFNWENHIRLMILDQYNNYGGPEHDRGLFRHTTHGMTPEHDIDLQTINFTPFEHYQWYYDISRGFRTWFGSLDLGQFAIHHEINNDVELGSRFTMPLEVRRTFDQRQDRAIAILGLDYRLKGRHHIGFNHTFTEHKPDLDATLYYKYGNHKDGFFRFNATLPDWGNKSIYSIAENRDKDAFRHRRTYNIHPYYFSFTAATPVRNHFRAEAMAGVLTQSEAEIGPIFHPQYIHRDRQNAHYSGLLVEYARSNVTAGLTWKHTFTRFSRVSVSDEADRYVDLGNRQYQKIVGAHASYRMGNIHLQNWISRTRFSDTQYDIVERVDDFYPFDFEEYRYFMKSRVIWRPAERGVITGLEWNADYRDMFHEFYSSRQDLIVAGYDYRRYYRDQIRSRNERITLIIGYQFTRHAFLMAGVSIDIDGDYERGQGNRIEDPRRFDGGFARLVLDW